MRILHAYKVYQPDIEGGIPAVISALTRHKSNHQHTILTARLRGSARNFDFDGTPVEAVSSLGNLFSTPIAPAYIPTLIKRAKNAEVVVHHAPMPLNDMALIGLPSRTALVVYWHADIVGFPLLRQLVSPAVMHSLRIADKIVVSDRSTITHSPFLQPFADKCVVAPYGIDVEYWGALDDTGRIETDDLRQRYPRMVVSVGRLVPYKGLDVLIRALATVNAQAVIIGEGPLRADLERLATGVGVADRVVFTGRLSRDKIRSALHAAKALAFPSVSRAEAFGIIQLEAMAAGLPVVNTALSTAVPAIARHECEGFTVPPHDDVALADALRTILDQPDTARQLGASARARAFAEYSEARFVARANIVYEDAFAHRREQIANKAQR